MRRLSWAFVLLFACDCNSTSSDEPIPCGEALTCDPGSACLAVTNEPSCTDKLNLDDTCPTGTTDTYCGGAGLACCCEPAPPPTYRCVDASGCSGEAPRCDCVGDVCDENSECRDSREDGELRCETLPAP